LATEPSNFLAMFSCVICFVYINNNSLVVLLFARHVYEPGSLSSQARLKPLLKQIVEDIVDSSRPELVDVVHKSSGFGDFLKSGFG